MCKLALAISGEFTDIATLKYLLNAKFSKVRREHPHYDYCWDRKYSLYVIPGQGPDAIVQAFQQ